MISGAGAEEYTFTPTDTTSTGSYTCKVTFSTSGELTSAPHTFLVRDVTIATRAPKVNKGYPVTITCSYQFDATITPTITWTHKGTAFTAAQNNLVTDGIGSGTTGVKLYTVTRAAETDSGEYKCSGDYSGPAVQSSGVTVDILSKYDIVNINRSDCALCYIKLQFNLKTLELKIKLAN